MVPRLDGELPKELLAALTADGRDVADSVIQDVKVGSPADGAFRAEWFYNQYNIMALLTPAQS